MPVFDQPFTPIPQEQLTELEQDLLKPEPATQVPQLVDLDWHKGWGANSVPMDADGNYVYSYPPRSEWPTFVSTPEREAAMQRAKFDKTDNNYEMRCWTNSKFFAKEDEERAHAARYAPGVRGPRMTDEERKRRNREQMREARSNAKNVTPQIKELNEQVEAAKLEHEHNELLYAASRQKLETLRAKLRLAMVEYKLQTKN